jgi:hypothetical protein
MRIPNFKDAELTKFLTEWDREIQGLRKDFISNVSGNNSVLLISPSLKVFEVKVTDAGALTVTKVAG